jgi:chromosome segregation ATPase
MLQDTRLADRTAQLSQTQSADPDPPPTSPPPTPIGRRSAKPVSPAPPESTSLTALRLDLAKAQQERSELQTKLDGALRELEALKTRSKAESKRITQLTAGMSQMTIRLRDRDEELRGKAKLIENVQDENVTLNLQLNMADEQAKKLKKENQELVDRWMARMGKEAERMNDESQFR